MQRGLVGLASAALLVVSGLLFLFQNQVGGLYLISRYLVRSGLVLGGVWLAWPELATLNPYLFLGTLLCGAVMVMQPYLAWYLLPVLAAMWLFLPKRRKPKA